MKKTLVFVVLLGVFLVGCDINDDSWKTGRDIAEGKQAKMSKESINSVEIPTVTNFQERKTIAKWVVRWDKASIPAYLYIISFGKVLGYYVVDGKPASTTSYLMPEDEYYMNGAVLSTPDIDGTYGTNNPGIRFFTAEGAAVEWAGDGATYLYSDVPINFGYEVPRLSK